MRRNCTRQVCFLFFVMLALPAAAQHEGIRWQHDLESAKALARQSGRLVLVHFWTPSCAPCVTLEQTVFNQPGVATAIDAQFVPVKLNADEHPGTAQSFGINRVPMDVIITPTGEVVGKLVSPPTPGGYVADITQVARKYTATPGSPFSRATANVPAPSQINAAYANLPVSANSLPVASQQPVAYPFANQGSVAASPVSTGQTAVAPLSTGNQYTWPSAGGVAPQPAGVPASQVANTAATNAIAASPAPSSAANPYMAAQPVAPPLAPLTTAAPGPIAQQPPANTEAPAAAPPNANQLPAGAPQLGFDGYCPVSMRNNWKWIPGDPRWGIVHRGRTYWFASQAEQQQFWSDPDRYSPALSGMDPVMAIDHKQQVPGKREHSIDYDNLFYMFCSEATLQQFTANPERYAVGVREAMGIPRGRLVR